MISACVGRTQCHICLPAVSSCLCCVVPVYWRLFIHGALLDFPNTFGSLILGHKGLAGAKAVRRIHGNKTRSVKTECGWLNLTSRIKIYNVEEWGWWCRWWWWGVVREVVYTKYLKQNTAKTLNRFSVSFCDLQMLFFVIRSSTTSSLPDDNWRRGSSSFARLVNARQGCRWHLKYWERLSIS